MSKMYNLKEIAEQLNVSERTARRYIDAYINEFATIKENKYKVSQLVFDALIRAKKHDTDLTELDTNLTDNELLTEYFTPEEYNLFQKRLTEYPILKEQIEYLKEQIEKNRDEHRLQLSIFKSLIASIEQRNYIEAKSKGIE